MMIPSFGRSSKRVDPLIGDLSLFVEVRFSHRSNQLAFAQTRGAAMRRFFILMAAMALTTGVAAAKIKLAQPPYYLVPGSVPMDKGPDGNSIFLEAPGGLIVVDTGWHPEHAEKLLAYAKERGRPIAAI